jgi:hypothetical protein
MPRGVAFDDLLDEKLAGEPVDSKPTVTFGPAGMATAYGFFFVEAPRTAVASFPTSQPGLMGRRAADGIVGLDERFAGAVNAGGVRVRVHVPSEPPAQPATRTRPVRQLSAREQHALSEMVTLGGTLSGDFTFDELRSVFRTLARRYHPDRHIGCNEQDKTRLAEQFTRVRDAYKVLASRIIRVN